MIKNRILLPQTLSNHRSSPPFIILSNVESTNNYAMAKLQSGLVNEGVCLLAIVQTKGKGQMGKQWLSEPGSNITMSTIIKPTQPSYQPFLLSAATALACMDLLIENEIARPKIKWPNDIYINDRKAGGILIENLLKGTQVQYSIVGTGVNVNQSSFPQVGQPATSLFGETGRHFNMLHLARQLHGHLLRRTAGFEPGKLMKEYNSFLYKKDEPVRLRKENVVFSTTIREVNMAGELVCADSMERRFVVGEVSIV